MEASSSRLRLSILAVVVISLFGALFARMWYLQVMVSNRYQLQASANRVRTVQIEAPRGVIYDDKGRLLVGNRTSLVVTIDPSEYAKLSHHAQVELVSKVATELTSSGVPTKDVGIRQALADKQYSLLQPIPIAVDVPDDVDLYFSERASQYPSVAVERESVRSYPNGSLAANVLGYVGRISDVEIKAKQGGIAPTRKVAKPYQPDSEIGKTGVEAAYEDELRGTPGIEKIEVDAANNPVRVLSETKPVAGDNLVLTVDIDAQASAETALASQLAQLQGRRESGSHQTMRAPAGSVVAIDPNTGGVKAMATFPTYNPSDFVNGISTEEYQTLTGSGSDNNPLINRATQGQYAPGSTFKLVTATGALQHGLITGSTPFDDTGGFHTPNCVGAACFKRNSGGEVLGELSLPGALTRSSDAFFYKLGFQFYTQSNVYGPSALHDTAVSYGLAQPTGIPTGNEAVGFIPDAATEAERHKEAPKAFNGQWLPGDSENVAVGQGDVLVTPLQLANAYATFANHGTRYQPQVVQAILKPGGDPTKPADVLTVVKPVVAGHVDLPPAMYNPILSGLQGVVSSPKGTAYQAFAGFNLQAVPLAGKTGTAEVTGKADTSLFASFGPVGSPQYAIVAVLEQSGFGADAAAPVVRHVWETVTGQSPTQVAPQSTGIIG